MARVCIPGNLGGEELRGIWNSFNGIRYDAYADALLLQLLYTRAVLLVVDALGCVEVLK